MARSTLSLKKQTARSTQLAEQLEAWKTKQKVKQVVQAQIVRQAEHPKAKPAGDTGISRQAQKKAAMRAARKAVKQHLAVRQRLPLAIGVFDELVAKHPEVDKRLIGFVLHECCTRKDYHRAILASSCRFSLDGKELLDMPITAEHKDQAKAALEKMKP